jgi:hypothetical protein
MAFDQATRNRLARFVGHTRDLLAEEFTRQLQNDYGLNPSTGDVTELSKLSHLNDTQRETARLLRETMQHYLASSDSKGQKGKQEVLDRIVREQAFTVLNRLCALRMAESRGLLMESIAHGYNSKGFQLFAQIAGASLGERGDAYRSYLFGLFDEFAVDLPVLFDRHSPQGRLFPRESTLLQVLDQINQADIDALWVEDETIGWIYQYWNKKEERKAMRDASSAPRNSRELAVRNQFFTPRYVVEFLTDNTLGRIWYEMTQGETRLKEQCQYLVRRPNEIFLQPGENAPEQPDQESLSPEELLQQPVYTPHRPIKDPREIRILDPACGSMHFGLYAFDLFECIYEEAWDRGLESLSNDFLNKETFLRDVPRLIIECNIHGIDIDPRAVQIAGLSLWLRAQKSWHAQGVLSVYRPRILNSNVVSAEPMPGSSELLKEFTETLHPPLLGQLLDEVFSHMHLAGEAGSLLKIEEEIAILVTEAKEFWLSRPEVEQMEMDLGGEIKAEQGGLSLNLTGITDEQFWDSAEERIYIALQSYAEQIERGVGYQRRLFANDTDQGFAFVDLCRKRYDVVLMNPPFGESSSASKKKLGESFSATKCDIFSMFVERWLDRLEEFGCLGAITNKTGFFLQTFERWRKLISTRGNTLSTAMDLGFGVLDSAMVETMAYTLKKSTLNTADKTLFIRLAKETNKQLRLVEVINSLKNGDFPRGWWWRHVSDFDPIPHNPMCYWAGTDFIDLFRLGTPFSPKVGHIYQGIATGDNFRFLRTRWEVSSYSLGRGDWRTYAKGGASTLWFSDFPLVLSWSKDGTEIKANAQQCYGSASRTIKNENVFFKPGLTYTQVTVKGFFARALPEGAVFDMKGPLVFVESGDFVVALGVFCSLPIRALAKLITDCRQWHPTNLMQIPYPKLDVYQEKDLGEAVKSLIAIRQTPLRQDEVSSLFCFFNEMDCQNEKEASISETVDNIVAKGFGASVVDFKELDILLQSNDTEAQNKIEDIKDPKVVSVSYVLGIAFGRWDVRFAIGETPLPELPNPFAPLPISPPGQLQNSHGMPISSEDVKRLKTKGQWNYPIEIPWNGILVDDSEHLLDIEASLHKIFQVISKRRWEAIEQDMCDKLGVRSLRIYLRKPTGFFADHLKRYSESRRQAPIYWPLTTKTGKYTVWVYYHRLTDQTLYTGVNDFVEPKILQVSEELNFLRSTSNRTPEQEENLEELTSLELELREFRDELLRIATFWRPNLNDGVLVTASPLWKLFQHKPWQKNLKQTWDKLEKGEYDWAHLALSIWPDRVVRASHKDRSYAIAHGLEDQLWEEVEVKKRGRTGKVTKKVEWRPRELTEDELQAIIEEVKAR